MKVYERQASSVATNDQFSELETVFRDVYRLMSREFQQYVESGMSGSQMRILESLHTLGVRKVNELADTLDVSMAAVTALIDKLESKGFVRRERSEEDRRVVWIEILADGISIMEEIRNKRSVVIHNFFSGLSDEDQAHLNRIFNQVKTNIMQG